MKGNYQRKSVSKKRLGKIFLIVFAVYVAVVVLQKMLMGAVSAANNSVLQMSFWMFDSEGSIPAYFRDRDSLKAEIEDLRSQLVGHTASALAIRNLTAENMELRSMFAGSTTPRVLANVVARPPQLPYDALLLDAGADKGIPEGAQVYLGENKAIGVVVRVFPDSSLVKLISSPDTISTVFIKGPNIYTTAVGMGGGVLQVNVPQEISFARGDLVVVPALGEGFYGEIEEVVSIPTEPVQYGFVTDTVPVQSLRVVSVSLEPVREITFEEARDVVREAELSLLRVAVPEGTLIEASSTPTSTASDVLDAAEAGGILEVDEASLETQADATEEADETAVSAE